MIQIGLLVAALGAVLFIAFGIFALAGLEKSEKKTSAPVAIGLIVFGIANIVLIAFLLAGFIPGY